MVEHGTAPALDRVFRALASRPRREILRYAAHRPCSVTQLAGRFDMSLAAVAKHVQVLVGADLLSVVPDGRVRWCRLRPETLDTAQASIEQLRAFWNARLDALERVVRRPRAPKGRA